MKMRNICLARNIEHDWSIIFPKVGRKKKVKPFQKDVAHSPLSNFCSVFSKLRVYSPLGSWV
jgi:hypothetical protein